MGDILKRGGVLSRRDPTTPPGKSRPAGTGNAGTKNGTAGAMNQEDRALQEELRAQMVRASGLPLETRAAMRLSTLKLRRGVKGLREALAGARAVLRQELAWLTLCGTVGLGKTHIAVAIGWEWLEQGRMCRYAWYLDAPLLILDDLGTEKLTDWAAEKLDTLIDHRYIKGLPLVVTTNVPAAQLSPRIASRLQDRRLGRVVTLSGPDYRISE